MTFRLIRNKPLGIFERLENCTGPMGLGDYLSPCKVYSSLLIQNTPRTRLISFTNLSSGYDIVINLCMDVEIFEKTLGHSCSKDR